MHLRGLLLLGLLLLGLLGSLLRCVSPYMQDMLGETETHVDLEWGSGGLGTLARSRRKTSIGRLGLLESLLEQVGV